MALPLIAAGIAAKAAAKKVASRAVGGITGKGAKQVDPVYRNMDKQVTPFYKNTGSTVKVNSNPNKTPVKGERNPTQTKLDREESLDPWYDKYGYPPTEVIKINSSKLKPNKIVKSKGALPKRGK